MAWLLVCSCIFFVGGGRFLLPISAFAAPRTGQVLCCWIYSAKFLGKKRTDFSSSPVSYTLKFTPRWHTGKSELCYRVRALIESFGTECCEVITSVRQASLLVLPPCKHTPANPELTHTQKQWHLVDAEQIAPNGMHNLCASETRLTGKKKKKDKLCKQLSAI